MRRATRGPIGLDLREWCASVRGMRPPLTYWLLMLAVVLSMASCKAIVGDACLIDTDCGTGLVCDASQPEGYCTRANCSEQECPDEGLCVAFNMDASYCMRPCDDVSDCRDGYQCVDDFGLHPFCSPAP